MSTSRVVKGGVHVPANRSYAVLRKESYRHVVRSLNYIVGIVDLQQHGGVLIRSAAIPRKRAFEPLRAEVIRRRQKDTAVRNIQVRRIANIRRFQVSSKSWQTNDNVLSVIDVLVSPESDREGECRLRKSRIDDQGDFLDDC